MDEKFWYSFFGLSGIVGVLFWIDVINAGQVRLAAAGGIVIYGFWYIYGNWERLRQKAEEMQGERRDLANTLTEPELIEKIQDWQEDIDFVPNGYKTDSVPLFWEAEDGKAEELWYFYTLFGPNNNPMLIFIDSTSGHIKSHTPFKDRDAAKKIEKSPFSFSDRYNEYDKDRDSRTRRKAGMRYRRTQSDGSDGGGASIGDMTDSMEEEVDIE